MIFVLDVSQLGVQELMNGLNKESYGNVQRRIR
jgi:hypothetical protein